MAGEKSAVNWKEIRQNSSVRQVTTMTLPNTGSRHDAQTSERLLSNLDSRMTKLNRILDRSMEEINGRR